MKKLFVLLISCLMVLSCLSGCSSKTEDPDAKVGEYTYNYAVSTFPTNWNPHTYETATDSDILGYISEGFYTFDYNDTKDGYVVAPSMAVGDPEDVTDQYIGQYGLQEGDAFKAYKITLRQDIKWDDGTAITANDFVESAKRLLNPEAQNYRADSLYSGNLVVVNAKSYLYSGQSIVVENAVNDYYEVADLVKGDDGVYTTPDGGTVYVAVDWALSAWLNGNSLATYVGAYGDAYFDTTDWDALVAAMDADEASDTYGLAPLTDETLGYLSTTTTGNPAWGESDADLPAYFAYATTYPEIDFSEVGIFTTGDYELVLVLEKELSGFYLLYALTDSWLVKTDVYDKCVSVTDGVYTNTYGTSASNTPSYGPYKLDSFIADKQYVLTKNQYCYEFNDADDTYMTTRIRVDYVPEASTRLQMFLQGQLDTYGLTIDDMETYSKSDYCYFTPGDSTFAIAFNPDYSALKSSQENAGANINKTILCIDEFRMAISFGLNRAEFCLATSPTNSAAIAIFSQLIISNPEQGIPYRTTQAAKETVAKFWEVDDDYGDGKMYATIDDAIASVTGYNLEMSRQLFNTAYDKAIELGYMSENDVVEITVGIPNSSSAFYSNGYEFIVNNFTEVVKGTKLEGKLTFNSDDTIGNSFANALKTNQVNMLFGVGWTGSALDPYNLMEAYVSPNYQYDPAFDYSTVALEININGVDYKASVTDWNNIMMGAPCVVENVATGEKSYYSCGSQDDDPEARLTILAALEQAILCQYDFIPIMDDSSAVLRSMNVNYYTEEYVFGLGRGGIKYYTYNMDDADWTKYVKDNGGELDYK